MSKAVLISVKPKWCELIALGEKTVEVRKNRPKLKTPFKVYIYRTKGKAKHIANGKWFYMPVGGSVIGDFVCDCITQLYGDALTGGLHKIEKELVGMANLTEAEMRHYAGGKDCYAWHISDLVIYDKPKELSEFMKPCICPEIPYCATCPVGYEYISETEAEFYRVDGECATKWVCLNYLKRPPQSWYYVEELKGGDTE